MVLADFTVTFCSVTESKIFFSNSFLTADVGGWPEEPIWKFEERTAMNGGLFSQIPQANHTVERKQQY